MNTDRVAIIAMGLALGLVILITTACGSNQNKGQSQGEVTFNTTLDCANIESSLVDGLPATLGKAPSTPENVQKGIIYYRELALQNDQNSQFYSSNANLMEQKLNEFNERVISECQ